MTDTTSGLTEAELAAIEEEIAKAVDIAGHWMVSSSTRRYTVNEALLVSEVVEKMPRLVREIRRLRAVETMDDEDADRAAFVAWNRQRRQDGAGPWRGVDLASVAWHAALAYARKGTNVDA